MKLLEIQPYDLRFEFVLNKRSSCQIQLTNITGHNVAFKVKTTAPKKFCVRPNQGIVMPRSTYEITVTMRAYETAPPDMVCREKFLIPSTIVPSHITIEDITSTMFSGKDVDMKKMKVYLVSPKSPINRALKLLDIQPKQLSFPFELEKFLESQIQVKNNTPHYVAFKIRTTAVTEYCVRPNRGILMPKSNCEISVTMRPYQTAPPDMVCKHKFLIQSRIVPFYTTIDDITSNNVFSEEEEMDIEEEKLLVCLVSPLISPNSAESNEGSSEELSMKLLQI